MRCKHSEMDADALRALVESNCELIKFPGLENTDELKACVQELIPFKYDEFMITNVRGNTDRFKFSLKCKIADVEEIKRFVRNYTERNNETLRISKNKKLSNQSSYLHIHYYRCQHNTRNPNTRDAKKIITERPCKRFKNTDCPFMLSVKVLQKPEDEYACIIEAEWNHNHTTVALQVIGFKDIPEEVVEHIKVLFKSGLTPGMAYREHKKELRARCKSELVYHHVLADRSKAPRRRDFNALYEEYNR